MGPDADPLEQSPELTALRAERDRALAALGEVYHPRMRAMYDELQQKRAAIWQRYDDGVAELKAAA